MVIVYLLLGSILLTIGSVLYLIFTSKMAPKQARNLIYFIVILALSLPIFTPGLPRFLSMINEGRVFYEDYMEWNVVDIKDPQLLKCYNDAIDSKAVCECEIRQKADRITFENIPFFNFLIKYGEIIFYTWLIITILLSIRLFYLLFSLHLLIRKSYTLEFFFKGVKIFVLYPKSKINFPLSAFTLFNNYLLWSPILDEIDKDEKDCIITHEIEHLKSKDTWHLIFFELLKIFFWASPGLYILHFELKKQMEFNADDAAAKQFGSRLKYAELLLRLQEKLFSKNKIQSFISAKRLNRLVNFNPNRMIFMKVFSRTFLLSLVLAFSSYLIMPIIQKQNINYIQYEFLNIVHRAK